MTDAIMPIDSIPSTQSSNTWHRLLRTFVTDLRLYRHRLMLSYLLSFLQVLTTLLLPWPLKVIIDHGITGAPLSSEFRWLNSIGGAEMLIAVMIGAFMVITVLYASTGAGSKLLEAKVREGLGLTIRDRLLSQLQMFPPWLAPDERRGDLLYRLVSDVNTFAGFQTKTLPLLFRYGATVLLILLTMFWLEPLLGLGGLCLLPLFGFSIWRYGRQVNNATMEKRRREGEVAGLAQEIVQGLSATKGLGHEQQLRERFSVTNAESLKAGVLATRTAIDMERALQIGQGIAVALMTGGGALLVLRGVISIGDLTVFISYMTQLLKPVEKVNELASTFSRGLASGERLLSLLDRLPHIPENPTAVSVKHNTGTLELNNVSFRYSSYTAPDSRWVLRDITMRLEPGRLAVLLGESGSGKSTLLGLLARFFDPTKGELLFNGLPYPHITVESLRSHITLMVQDIHLFAGTIRSELTPPHRLNGNDDRIWDVLHSVHLDEFVRSLPQGLDTSLSENGLNWSGGQRRRLSLARAILLDRPILLLDEPLAHVDRESESVILEALEGIRHQRTLLISTHSPSLIQRADEIFHLKAGRISRTRPAPSSPSHSLVRHPQ